MGHICEDSGRKWNRRTNDCADRISIVHPILRSQLQKDYDGSTESNDVCRDQRNSSNYASQKDALLHRKAEQP